MSKTIEISQDDLTSLREDLAQFVKAQLGLSISEQGESLIQTSLRLHRMSLLRAKEFGIVIGDAEVDTTAPTAVAIPERMPEADHPADADEYALGWNACLDKVKEMNQ